MKLNIASKIRNMDDEPLQEKIKGNLTDITIGHILVNALLIEQNNKPISGPEKIKRFELARKIYKANKGGVIEVTSEELTIAKSLALEIYPPLIAGQVSEIIEQLESKKADKNE